LAASSSIVGVDNGANLNAPNSISGRSAKAA
jgi:hypothetical protein